MKYLIVVERTKSGYSAYSPDLPGCAAAASTRQRTEKAMSEAIALHLEGLRSGGGRVPAARSYSAYVEIEPRTLNQDRRRRTASG